MSFEEREGLSERQYNQREKDDYGPTCETCDGELVRLDRSPAPKGMIEERWRCTHCNVTTHTERIAYG